MLLSKEEARKFCYETWFPRLKIGDKLNTKEFSQLLDELLKIYSPNIEISDYDNRDNVGRETSKGFEQVKNYYEYMITTYPKIEFSILDIFPTEKGFILWYEGKNAGPAPRFQGMTIVELTKADDGLKIAKLVEFYNLLPFMPH